MEMNKIFLQDNTIRDGFQQIGIKKDISTAISTIKILNTLNIDSVEIGMCSSDFDFNIIKKKINALDKNKKPVILTRLKEYDINKSIKLKSLFKNTKIKLLIPISDLHVEKKLKKTKEQFLEDIIYFQEVLHKHKILIDVCLEDATRADPIYLFKILNICNKYQNEFVTIADTVGFCTPEEYGNLINTIYKKNYNFKISVHCHNDLGLSTANTISGIINGAEQIESTILGIGERAGNTSLDEVAYILRNKYNASIPPSDKDIFTAGKELSKILDYIIPPTKPIIGNNAFKHESGIHQHGMRIDKRMYQYVDNSKVGIPDDESRFNIISHISSKQSIEKSINNRLGEIPYLYEFSIFFRHISQIVGSISLENAYELYLYNKTVS